MTKPKRGGSRKKKASRQAPRKSPPVQQPRPSRKKKNPPPAATVSKPIPPLPPLAPGESFEVPQEIAGNTVLAILRALRPGESWSQLRTRMHRAYVTLNGVVCIDEARRTAAGDLLSLNDQPRPRPQPSEVRIQYVDPHVVVVEKPAGMMTHRRPEERNWSAVRKSRQPALDEALNDLLNRRSAGSSQSRGRQSQVRCVHRLDRDTSGLLVFARNDSAETQLVAQFRKHTVHRIYWTIVHGRPQDGTIVSHLARDRGDGRRGSVDNPLIGQRAVTHVRCLEEWGPYSLVECRLETGRTNQIRIHLAEAGHLVCGDPKYGQPLGAKSIVDQSAAPRLALHAAELGFIHPVSGEELYFRMPFPRDLEEFASRLKLGQQRR